MKKIIFEDIKDFNIVHTLECGQCFRWKKEDDGSYTGVIKNGVINIAEDTKHKITVMYETDEDIESVIKEYFDMNRDYSNIKRIISVNDEKMVEAIKYGYGIRILCQDSWEMLISYIISAANNIPRISKTIENISKAYGKKILFNKKEYYLFPTPEELSRASIEDLRKLNLGFRDKYIYNATKAVFEGKINLKEIEKMPYKDAKKELMKLDGVGAKVADCILLFSMNKIEAFPIDTWIKKVMIKLYNTEDNLKNIEEYAVERFGKYAGIAQQYLFYYMRENN